MLMDITEYKQKEMVLADRRRELEQMVTERTAELQASIGELLHFSYTITHDMRAPLRAMRGYSEMILATVVYAEDDNHLANLVVGVLRSRHLRTEYR